MRLVKSARKSTDFFLFIEHTVFNNIILSFTLLCCGKFHSQFDEIVCSAPDPNLLHSDSVYILIEGMIEKEFEQMSMRIEY